MVTWIVQNTRVIFHDNEMACECVVFLQKEYVLCMISRHAITLKELEYYKAVKKYAFWNGPGIRGI